MTSLRRWSEPPPMEAGAPMPALSVRGARLLVAYVCRNPLFPGWNSGAPPDHPGFNVYSAVLEFEGVTQYSLGPPNDERLFEHPLYVEGLDAYGFFQVNLPGAHESVLCRWIGTFHDETLDVTARCALVLNERIEGEDTSAIVRAMA